MKKDTKAPADSVGTRLRAPPRKGKSAGPSAGSVSAQDAQRLLHELQVHRIELESQNQELIRAREELETQLRQSTQLYDFAPVGYVTLGRDGAVRKANLTAARLIGIERSRLEGMRFELLIATRSRETFREFLINIFGTGSGQTCEVALEVGEPLSVHIEATPSEDGQECRAALLDTTERQRLEETMRFRMALTEFAQDSSIEGLIQKTLDQMGAMTNSPIGFYHFVEADQKTLSLQAWSTRTVTEFCTAEGKGQHYPIDQAGVWADCIRQRRPLIHNDYRALPNRKGLPQGHATVVRELTVPILRGDRIVAVAGVGNKPTDYVGSDLEIVSFLADMAWAMIERKRQDEELRHSEALFRNLFESMSEAFALCEVIHDEAGHPVDWRYLEVNPAFATLTGLPIEGVRGRTVREVIPGIEPYWIETFARIVATGRPERLEHSVAGLGRRYDAFAWRAKESRFAVVFTDVTERRAAEEMLKETARRAEEAAEVLRDAEHNKNQFLAMLSHELRNPLGPIHSSLFVLDRAPPGSEQASRARAVLERQAVQLTRLIDDLLDMTRLSKGKIRLQQEHLDLREVVLRVVEDHRPAFQASGVELDVVVPSEVTHLYADAARLSQALGNLLNNAVKFTPRGRGTSVLLQCDARAEEAVLRVQDNGAGIEAAMLPRLFDSFVQADRTLERSRGGLGLGLALVKGLVEMQGGSVSATSKGLDKGAEFTIRLPLAPGVLAPAIEQRQPGPPTRRRVLIIEDNVEAADSLRDAIELVGHDVNAAYGGAEGLIAAHTFKPDVVLCDIGLPVMDGFAVARAFRADERLRGTYLVAVTGYAQPEDLKRAREAGFDKHIAKPLSLDVLEALLAEGPVGESAPSS